MLDDSAILPFFFSQDWIVALLLDENNLPLTFFESTSLITPNESVFYDRA